MITAAGALGLRLNRFGISILPDVGLYFGGILYLTVALRFGPGAGAFAALLAAPPWSPILDGPSWRWSARKPPPGAMARRGTQAPLGDLLFWGVAGTPLTLLVYIGILHYPSPLCWVLVVTPILNGFSNAIVAQFLDYKRMNELFPIVALKFTLFLAALTLAVPANAKSEPPLIPRQDLFGNPERSAAQVNP